jgi:hypothetical protein
MLARTLGHNIKVAVTWQQAASGDWTSYAADLSRNASGITTSPPPQAGRWTRREPTLPLP